MKFFIWLRAHNAIPTTSLEPSIAFGPDLFKMVKDDCAINNPTSYIVLWWILWHRNQQAFNTCDSWSMLELTLIIWNSISESQIWGLLHLLDGKDFAVASWSPPHQGAFKINCDARKIDSFSRAGFGCVIRDSHG
ncbi:hypothetical protein PIB30_079503 [Stylosanthes scabra]|uniref:Reverse transcriptase zinc-binding domain-containing protein n=1 Tax=Stylosanthes scabra TaxID=79078 RepID=A0ABU6TTD4_9FABA|nr:hypothetical protein [Stylosanthes scabra]